MKERPILFSAPMVRALLDGSKTQTRRICKSQPYANGYEWDGNDFLCHNDYLPPSAMLMDFGGKSLGSTSNLEGWESECPYGQPGDRLYVRETFMDLTGTGVEHHDADGRRQRYAFAADSPPGSYGDEARKGYGLKWKPSIHMPRAASRILLEVVAVRVEPLNDCSEADAQAEGVIPSFRGGVPIKHDGTGGVCREAYAELWESINGAGSWATNPWVWVVEFKRVAP
jgi:hypothetical protein